MAEKNRRLSWRNRILIAVALVIVAAAIVIGFSLKAASFFVDMWWFDSVGYGIYFWQRLLYRYAVLATSTLLLFLVFWLNFRFTTRYLRKTPESADDETALGKLGRVLRSGSPFVYIPLSLVLAAAMAWPLYENWEQFLLLVFSADAGTQDALIGKDISWYLFNYPIYKLMLSRMLLVSLTLFAGSAILYSLEYRTRIRKRTWFPRQAALHLGALAGLVVLILIWHYLLQRYALVYTDSHQPLFYGPGYLEMRYVLPLIWAQIALVAATGAAVLYSTVRRKALIVAGALAACFFLVMGLRHSGFLQAEIDRYWIEPNRLKRESPFIDRNVKNTLRGYSLHQAELRDFTPGNLTAEAPVSGKVLHNIPLWEKKELNPIYRELQQLRTYYTFPDINVDRYSFNQNYQQVFLAARQLDYARLPQAADNWVNRHLVYTHGYGVAMNPASQRGEEPFQWLVHGVPLHSTFETDIERPEIYYGIGTFNDFVIAPNESGEFDYARTDEFVTSNYQGHGGVSLSSYFSRLVFSKFFDDKNILISTRLNGDSRILFRRNVVERIRNLTPYLLLDREIYPVMTSQRLYWIQDAYTTSDRYPGSQPSEFGGRRFNYIRNSVKIVVDAYDGDATFYVADPNDPVISTYRRIYPGLFKDLEAMPPELKPHIRYPKDLFEIQMEIFAEYHQTDPQTFFEQEDVWEFARTLKGEQTVKIHPYYLTLALIDSGSAEFLLVQPMTPLKRDNLRALVVAGCDGDNYGRIVVYSFPKGEVVYSPSQVAALISAEPKIVEQFNLWNIAGSNLVRGNIIILPVGRNVLYLQPVFLQTDSRGRIPELHRVVLSEGHVAVMGQSTEDAYQLLKARIEQIKKTGTQGTPADLPSGQKP